jgi:D-sedoheptulose 7-phosphate isomerase
MNNIDHLYNENLVTFANSYLDYLNKVLSKIDREEIKRFVNTLLDARDRNASIYFIGNGGSATTSSHFANDIARPHNIFY